jgi:uncharacterized protein (TIGR03086 family)
VINRARPNALVGSTIHDVIVARHRRACDGFSLIVGQGEGHWTSSSPCPEWDARSVVEHVIGFHDVLLLRPLGTKPTRPKDDPVVRWEVTVPAIRLAMDAGSVRGPDEPAGSSDLDLDRLLPMLTAEVLVHTWDLARAIGVDPRLDPELCELSRAVVGPNDESLRSSGLFGPQVIVPESADAATRLVAFMGRDPQWSP